MCACIEQNQDSSRQLLTCERDPGDIYTVIQTIQCSGRENLFCIYQFWRVSRKTKGCI